MQAYVNLNLIPPNHAASAGMLIENSWVAAGAQYPSGMLVETWQCPADTLLFVCH